MLKVLLAYRCSEEGRGNPFERVVPVGLCSIHACLRAAGVPSVLANFSAMDADRVREILLAEKPDIVGISCFTFNRSASVALAALARATLPRCRIVIGGPHATHAGASLLQCHPEIDACVVGEGERTLEALVRTLSEDGDPRGVAGLLLRQADTVVATGPAAPIEDLDALPFPALYPDGYGVDPRVQYPYLVTSRGCPARCSFCSSPQFWGSRVRFRSAGNILDELQLLRDRFGLLYVSFRDDIFTLNKSRLIELCQGMIERKVCFLWDCQTRVNTIDEERLVWMKRAGALIVQYGIESGSQRILDRLQKGQRLEQIDRAAACTRRVGLVLSIYLITGAAEETEEDVRATEEMVRRIRPHDGIVTPLAVFPGTDLWDERRERHGEGEDFWEGIGHDGVFVRPEPFTENAMLRLSTMLESEGARGAYTRSDYAAHRSITGGCYATDLMEGDHLERNGRAGAARVLYERLARREPWNPWPFVRLGRLCLEDGDGDGAEVWLARAHRLAPKFSDVRLLRARARRLKMGRGGAAAVDGGQKTATLRRRPASSVRGFQSYPPPRRLERVDEPR